MSNSASLDELVLVADRVIADVAAAFAGLAEALAGQVRSTSQVAAAAGVTPAAVRLAIREGRLAGVLVGGRYMIPVAAAEAFVAGVGRRGGRS